MPIPIRLRSTTRAAAALAVVALAVAGISDAGVRAAAPPERDDMRVPILMYHRIAPAEEARDARRDLVVTPDEFARQMEALARSGWHSITLATLAHDLAAKSTPPSRTFVVTIDDGRDDGLTHAAPILRRHGFRATYFVVAGRIGKPGHMTAAQLRTLTAAGDEIADHTTSHVPLAGQDRAALHHEICDAAETIGASTGHRPETFAYPFGKVDEAAAAAVRACPGIMLAVTTQRGIGESWTGRFEIPRLPVGPGTSPADLAAMLEPMQPLEPNA